MTSAAPPPYPNRSSHRIPAATVLRSPLHLLAFGLGSGLAPRAPGTFGTGVGVLLFVALQGLAPLTFALVVMALTVAAIGICDLSSRQLGVHDHPGIVLDEIVAFQVAAAPTLPALHFAPMPSWLGIVLAFALFRLFDVWKPWPIARLDEHVPGGLGIMIDDLMAAVFAGLVLAAICVAVIHGGFVGAG
jgi:phosphatidylglycerophosphatase A